MSETGIIAILLALITSVVSYKGFVNQHFFNKYVFNVDRILLQKDYKRIITSGFLHAGWVHLILNMVTLLLFSGSVELYLGNISFLIVYFAGLIGGNLFSLLIHKNHGDYSAVGASGAVSGIIFASIALFPGISISLLVLPIYLPGWLFGILFVLFSIYGIKSRKDNIGHDAHLGGALVGMLTALLLKPYAFIENYIVILVIAVPALAFIYLIITKPALLLIDNLYFKKHHHFYSIDHAYNSQKAEKQNEIDRILDKINKYGINSLTNKEKNTLRQHSKSK